MRFIVLKNSIANNHRDAMFDRVIKDQRKGKTYGSFENNSLCFLYVRYDSYDDGFDGVDLYEAILSLRSRVIKFKFELSIPIDFSLN